MDVLERLVFIDTVNSLERHFYEEGMRTPVIAECVLEVLDILYETDQRQHVELFERTAADILGGLYSDAVRVFSREAGREIAPEETAAYKGNGAETLAPLKKLAEAYSLLTAGDASAASGALAEAEGANMANQHPYVTNRIRELRQIPPGSGRCDAHYRDSRSWGLNSPRL